MGYLKWDMYCIFKRINSATGECNLLVVVTEKFSWKHIIALVVNAMNDFLFPTLRGSQTELDFLALPELLNL